MLRSGGRATMSAGWHGAKVLELVSDGVDMDEAAQRLLEGGADVEVLGLVEEFVRALDTDPTARDRALLLIERTRLLAERGAAGSQRSDQLRADATRMQAGGVGAAIEAFSGVLRHELATPITVARMALEALGEQRDDPAMVGKMVEIAQRNLRLADHLLEVLGRAQALQRGPVELSWAQVDLGELVRECVGDVGTILAGRHEVVVAVEQAVVLPADPDGVRQILSNLLTNAAKFSPDSSEIEVSVSVTAEHAAVAVRDRGSGISPEDVQRIFEAGQRLDRNAPGMGLGLFVARQLARAHGGDLHVEEAAGGSRFVLQLPLSGARWQASLERREDAVSANADRHRERDSIADARDVELGQREGVADQRDDVLASREALAHERDADLGPRGDA